MSKMIRTTASPRPRQNAGTAPRILMVRQPIKSVRSGDDYNPALVRAMLGIAAAGGGLLALALLGVLGYSLGYASVLRTPELSVGLVEGFVAGALMVVNIPGAVIEAGLAATALMMIGFLLIAIPAGAVSAVKTYVKGGPKPPPIVVTFSYVGAIAAALHAGLMVYWIASPWRGDYIADLPFEPEQIAAWASNLQIVAGLDVLALTASVLWVILCLRLATPVWLKALSATIAMLALAVVAAGFAATNGAASQVQRPRPKTFIDYDAETWRLILGETEHQTAMLLIERNDVVVELRNRPEVTLVLERETIVEFADRE